MITGGAGFMYDVPFSIRDIAKSAGLLVPHGWSVTLS